MVVETYNKEDLDNMQEQIKARSAGNGHFLWQGAQRAAGSAEADQARAILATMPPDPDVEWHRTLLQTALQ